MTRQRHNLSRDGIIIIICQKHNAPFSLSLCNIF